LPAAIRAVARTLGSYALVAAINATLLISWARYNQLRFRGRERRRPATPVTLKDLSEQYGRPVSDVAEWQQARILTLHHDETGRLQSVELGALPAVGIEAA
jgi:biofilm PGA synthesis protein PgaD